MWYGRSGDLQESTGTPGQEGTVSFLNDSEKEQKQIKDQLLLCMASLVNVRF
jgi:hypothetical protein